MLLGFIAEAFAQAPGGVIMRNVPALQFPSMDTADFDGDGDLDLLLVGQNQAGDPVTRLLRYEGRIAEPVPQAPPRIVAVHSRVDLVIRNIRQGVAKWVDYDNDGDPDIFLSGLAVISVTNDLDVEQPVTEIFRNDAGSAFTPQQQFGFEGVYAGAADWADYDADGDLDLLLSGDNGSGRIAYIYRNDGGTYTRLSTSLPGVTEGSVAWGDYDADGDLDIVLTGMSDDGPITKVFQNIDLETFTEVDSILPGVFLSEAAWGDYDGDDDLDLLISGGVLDPNLARGAAYVYRNDNGAFVDAEVELPGIYAGSAQWGDWDGDRDLDIMVMGTLRTLDEEGQISAVYRNARGNFAEVFQIRGVLFGHAKWYDYNDGGLLDLLVMGRQNNNVIVQMWESDNPPLGPPVDSN